MIVFERIELTIGGEEGGKTTTKRSGGFCVGFELLFVVEGKRV